MTRYALPLLMLAALSQSVQASGWWGEHAKQAYVARCSKVLTMQSMPTGQAVRFCQCMANGMESEFSSSEYEAMMKSEPNPKGDAMDRRLFGVIQACQPNRAQ